MPNDLTKVMGRLQEVLDEHAVIKPIVDEILVVAGCIEHHFHNTERWYGKLVAGNEINMLDSGSLNVFQANCGNNDWGTAICVKGTADVPNPGTVEFDCRMIQIVATQRTGVHLIRLAWGNTYADAITAGDFTEVVINPTSTGGRSSPIEVRTKELPVNTKLWVNVKGATNGTVELIKWNVNAN
jgi:hypothetical protein